MKPLACGNLVQNTGSRKVTLFDGTDAGNVIGIIPVQGLALVIEVDPGHSWYIKLLSEDGLCGWTADYGLKRI